MKKLINFLVHVSNTCSYIAEFLRSINLHEEYYVYVPSSDKPRVIHKTFESARSEAERLAEKLNVERVEVLQVVKRYENIPF